MEQARNASADKGLFTSAKVICPVCNGTGWEFISDNPKTVRKCTWCNGAHELRVADMMQNSGIQNQPDLSAFNWSIYQTDVKRQRKLVSQFVERLPEFENQGLGLYITSRVRGSGKTFLASAIGKELVDRHLATVRFVRYSDLLEISKGKPDGGADPLTDLMQCRVLILDDLGAKQTGRDWLNDVLFRIVDQRYQKHLSIIATSNILVSELDLDDRVVDRLNRMTCTVKLPEVCVRAIEADAKKREFLKRIGVD